MKKVLSLVLVLLMMAGMLLSCQKNEDPLTNPDGTPAVVPDGEVDLTDTDENNYLNDRLPTGEELAALGFAGSTVKILGYEEEGTIPLEDSAKDPLQSKLYYHWKGIEERFDITISVKLTKGYFAQRETFFTEARADDAAYDLIQTESLFPISLAMEGRLCNLKNLGFPDLAMPWWPQSVEQYSQHGGLYFIGSNSSATGISNMSVIYVNDGVITSKGEASPVKSVLRGVWTVEQMTNIVKQFAGAAENTDAANRYYGLVVDHTSRMTSFYYSSGFSEIVNNADGVGELAYDDESELEAITKGLNKFSELTSGPAALIHQEDSTRDIYDELLESRTAMQLGWLGYIRNLQNTEDYTVVPLPLLDESQYDPSDPSMGYRTVHRDCYDLWSIPTTTANKVLGGMILEANASDEYRNIGPFYFEQYLKDRYANGADGRKCFDLLRDSVIYDLGRIAQLANVGVKGDWTNCFLGPNQSFQNTFADSVSGKLDAQKLNLNTMLDQLAKHVNN